MSILVVILKSSLLLGLFYLVYKIFLQKETHFNFLRYFLAAGILVAVVLPFCLIQQTEVVEQAFESPLVDNNLIVANQTNIGLESSTTDWWTVFLYIYFVGVLVMIVRFFTQILSLLTLLKRTPGKNKLVYNEVDKNIMPFSFFNYIIFNPKLHTDQELSFILLHEAVHAKQYHSIDMLFANILLIIQWFNPLAWKYKFAIEENLEFIADKETVSKTPNKVAYQLALVKVSSASTFSTLTSHFQQSFIKKRIVMINKKSSNKINLLKTIVMLPVLAIFLYSFNIKKEIKYITTNTSGNNLSNSKKSSLTAVAKNFTSPKITTNKEIPVEKIGIQDFTILITKDSSPEDLDALKQKWKVDYNVDLNFKNLNYNSSNELTSIGITYNDANGNSGTYSISTTKPINTIYISRGQNGSISFKNKTDNNEYEDMEEANDSEESVTSDRSEEMKKRMQERRAEMESRKKELESKITEMDSRKAEMEIRKIEMDARKEESDTRKIEMEARILEMKKRQDEMLKRSETLNSDIKEKMKERRAQMEDNIYKSIENTQNSIDPSKLKVISKTATDEDLERIKSEFKEKQLEFTYTGLKRNKAGEITAIKIKLTNNNGSKSSSSYSSNKGITPITLGMDGNTSVIRN